MNYFSWANWLNSFIFSMLIWPIWSLDSKIEWTNGINLFFACWCNFMKINLKVLGVGMVKTGCGQSCDGTLKLTVSEEWTDGINWFFVCWYRFTKIKRLSKIFFAGHGQKLMWPVWSWDSKICCLWYTVFLHACTNSGKLNVDSIIFRRAWSN